MADWVSRDETERMIKHIAFNRQKIERAVDAVLDFQASRNFRLSGALLPFCYRLKPKETDRA